MSTCAIISLFLLQFSTSVLSQSLIITGVIDATAFGPPALELYARSAIADLSEYSVGVANNGGGTDGSEYTFPSDSISAGSYIYVSSGANGFEIFFGFSETYSNFRINMNGNDAIELFYNGQVIDVFGDINTDGTGQAWEYTDSWAYRVSGSSPGGSTFSIDEWTIEAVGALSGIETNADAIAAGVGFPTGTFSATAGTSPGNDICFASMARTIVDGKGMVAMKDLSVGDKVMTANGKFRTVHAIDHFHKSKPTEFLQIHTSMAHEQPLELSALHMIFLAGKSNPVPASLVKVGDGIQTVNSTESHIVTKINRVVRNGFYNALTEDGTIVVDGVVASTYPSLTGKEHIEVGGVKLMSHQEFVHMAWALIRTVYTMQAFVASAFSLDMGSTEEMMQAEEYFAWYSQIHNFFFEMLQSQNSFFQVMILVSAASILGLLRFFSSQAGVISFVVSVATTMVFSFKRRGVLFHWKAATLKLRNK